MALDKLITDLDGLQVLRDTDLIMVGRSLDGRLFKTTLGELKAYLPGASTGTNRDLWKQYTYRNLSTDQMAAIDIYYSGIDIANLLLLIDGEHIFPKALADPSELSYSFLDVVSINTLHEHCHIELTYPLSAKQKIIVQFKYSGQPTTP